LQIAPASSDASHPSAAGTPPPLQSTSQLSPDDEALFRQLVRSHQGRLYRFIVKHIGWGSDAEDLTQQAFVEAARSYATFEGDDVLSETSCARPDPFEQLSLSESVRALEKALAELAPDMRDVLLLVALDELSYEEAAVMLSIPVGTVRSRVSRARSSLRKRLSAEKVELGF